MNVLTVKDLKKRYGDTEVVHGLMLPAEKLFSSDQLLTLRLTWLTRRRG